MKKNELAKAVAVATGITTKEAVAQVDAVFSIITDTIVSGETVDIFGFGKFASRETAPRKGRNPQTQEEIQIPAGKKPTFKPATALKDAVKQ